ncbi:MULTISPECIES: hypothetical protein [Streptomyces]|uniref:Uncharacterized protein n=1 Tax=Streptomyces griseofuscus TaxID=146922 RepID=A0A7H1PRK3_9ACTN|nr:MULTISPECIES: hypothetical protein [Streptomyces]MBA9050211.1 hypothetical protein [Streptomyces murinus]QNT90683.1 hypothetical protein HEP81_00346 [Streptomyces griseofuscus]BBC91534.1 hypothetical protein SRO_0358 [Streptomyces rochei]
MPTRDQVPPEPRRLRWNMAREDRERTPSIHSVDTMGRASFYWLAVLLAFALGTALLFRIASSSRARPVPQRVTSSRSRSPRAVRPLVNEGEGPVVADV